MSKGKIIAFPIERRIILEILHAARSIPAFPIDRHFDLSQLAEARRHAMPRISWTAIFLRGWGLVSHAQPVLRQLYMTLPMGYLYEYPCSVASVSVHRRNQKTGQDSLIFCRVASPETKSLVEIQGYLDQSKTGDIRDVFRDGFWSAYLPWPLRRIGWNLLMHLWGRKRAKTIGTFTISSLAGMKATNREHPLVATTSLSYSPLDHDDHCVVTLQSDHRVLDGVKAAECLEELECHFNSTVLGELRALSPNASVVRVAS